LRIEDLDLRLREQERTFVGAAALGPHATGDLEHELDVPALPRSASALHHPGRRRARAMGESVSDDVLVESMARALLGGAGGRDEGLSSSPIALTTCHRCGVTTQEAGGKAVVVDEVTVDCAK